MEAIDIFKKLIADFPQNWRDVLPIAIFLFAAGAIVVHTLRGRPL